MKKDDHPMYYIFHWTEASCIGSISNPDSGGLRPSTGGFCAQHEEEPGVNLTTTGWDPSIAWNENILYLARPVRITIDASQLDTKLLGPDLNSMLEDGVYDSMMSAGVDPDKPENQTWQTSLEYSGNCRYLANIPIDLIVDIKGFMAPRDWKINPLDYGYENEYDENDVLIASPDWHVSTWPGNGLFPDQPVDLSATPSDLKPPILKFDSNDLNHPL